MLLATWIFWSGRHKFIHVPPAGRSFFARTFNRETGLVLGRLAFIFAFMAVFWALWDQCGSTWTLQAEQMDRMMFGLEIRSSQMQTVNSILTLTFIPLFSYWLYPFIDRFWKLTSLRKIGLGIFTIGLSFLISAWIESRLGAGVKLSVGWQFPAYILLTAGEVMASITALEFAYTQAPQHLKAVVQAVYLLSVTAGNWFTAAVQWFISNPDGTSKLSGVPYFVFFAILAMVAALAFSFVARGYRERSALAPATPA